MEGEAEGEEDQGRRGEEGGGEVPAPEGGEEVADGREPCGVGGAGAEEDPGEGDDVEGEEAAQEGDGARGRRGAGGALFVEGAFEGLAEAVDGAPEDVGPAGAVPEAAEEHGED